jgi:hypothetical protein
MLFSWLLQLDLNASLSEGLLRLGETLNMQIFRFVEMSGQKGILRGLLIILTKYFSTTKGIALFNISELIQEL